MLLWFDRNGKQVEQVGSPSIYSNIELSRDGHRVAADMQVNGNRDIWVIDLARAVPSRLTFDPASDLTPVWAPDGSRIAFTSSRGESFTSPNKIYQKSSNGIGAEELLFTGNSGEPVLPRDWSSERRYIIFTRASLSTNDLWVLRFFGDRKPYPFLQSSFQKGQVRLSLDGRWLAYTTNESGAYQIVVQTFPDPSGGKWQVTAKGGMEPKWRRDGRELYYLGLDGKLMAAPVTGDRTFQVGQPVPLFQTTLTVSPTPNFSRYDVTADGRRFLVISPSTSSPGATNSAPITAVVNWTAALNKRNK